MGVGTRGEGRAESLTVSRAFLLIGGKRNIGGEMKTIQGEKKKRE